MRKKRDKPKTPQKFSLWIKENWELALKEKKKKTISLKDNRFWVLTRFQNGNDFQGTRYSTHVLDSWGRRNRIRHFQLRQIFFLPLSLMQPFVYLPLSWSLWPYQAHAPKATFIVKPVNGRLCSLAASIPSYLVFHNSKSNYYRCHQWPWLPCKWAAHGLLNNLATGRMNLSNDSGCLSGASLFFCIIVFFSFAA